MVTEPVPHSRPWYLLYPLSSFLALILAGAVTVAMWTLLASLAKAGMPSEPGTNILAWLTYVVIVVALFTIMWYFQTGILTSIMIAFVAWCHIGVIGWAFLWCPTDSVYKGPVETILPFLGILCIAVLVAIIHGAIVGARRRKAW